MKDARIKKLYNELMKLYGPQGWWPVRKFISTKKSGEAVYSYHPGDYSFPKTDEQVFEICLGAILTQNTSWRNVEKALENLAQKQLLNPKKLLEAKETELLEAIKPSGYYNQKLKKILIFTQFYINKTNDKNTVPTRDELLNLWGIGPETADSMLLYAYKVPSFVIDAYTKRILLNLGIIEENKTYGELKEIFEKNIKEENKNLVHVFEEYHALIVAHAKAYYNTKLTYGNDPLIEVFKKTRRNKKQEKK